jgi:hypothetical protein
MKRLVTCALFVAATAGVAAAQPGAPAPPPQPQPPPDGPPVEDLDTPPDPQPDPVPDEPDPDAVPDPEVPDPAWVAEPAAVTPAPARAPRPQTFSIGIGFGWDLPADVQLPNATSVRFRIPSGWTLEPAVALSRGESSVDDGMPPPNNLTAGRLMASLHVRKTLRTNGKADLDLVGGLTLENESSDPDGPDNTISTTSMSLVYGVAVGYWLSPHIEVTMTALNPVVVQSKRVEEVGSAAPDIETTVSSFGLIFDPNVIAMVHLHF